MGLVFPAGQRVRSVGRRTTAFVAAAMLTALSASSNAVEKPPALGEPGLRDARVPDSIPNISGVWQVRGFERATKPVEGGNPPWLPWNQEAYEKRGAAEKAGAPLYDPTAACLPSGMPRIIAAPYPVEIVQTPEQTVFLHEVQHLFRIVYMNAKHPERIEPSYMGHSVGHWEGDTLVIDTVGLVKSTQIDEAGSLHTEDLHVVERIRRVNDTLEILFTMTDPKAFTKTWTSKRIWRWRPDVRFIEYICEENNRNAPNEKGVLRNF